MKNKKLTKQEKKDYCLILYHVLNAFVNSIDTKKDKYKNEKFGYGSISWFYVGAKMLLSDLKTYMSKNDIYFD